MESFSHTERSIAGLTLTIALSLFAMPGPAVAADELSFMVFGDAPYGQDQIEALETTVAPVIREAPFPFLIHLGDLKGGGEPCTDILVEERYKQLMALHPGRVFYTPGDNEWTDCDRTFLAERFSEVWRLDFLRTLIASNPMTLPADWHYATQPEFPENARWTQGGVMFATVHIVSTNNGREEIFLDDIEATLDLVDQRDQANRVWLRAAFDAARQSDAGAVVIATQADVTKHAGTAPCSNLVRISCDGFAVFRDQLLRHAAGFRKPVLLVHGDTTAFCFDKTFGGGTAPKLWRLNAFGDSFGPDWQVNATVISVDPDDTEQPFAATLLMAGAAPGGTCPEP
jgi:hypothetical protein